MWQAAAAVGPEARQPAVAAAAHEALTALAGGASAVIGSAWEHSVDAVGRCSCGVAATAAGRKAANETLLRHAHATHVSEEDWHAVPPILLASDEAWCDGVLGPADTPDVTEVHEVLDKGGRVAPSRTADQTVAAIFWCAYPLVVRHASMLAALALAGRDALAGSRMLAYVAAAMFDSQVAAWRIKSRGITPTPERVIHGEAPSRVWPRTHERNWHPLVECAPHAEFPSQWCVALGAGVGAARALAGRDDVRVEVTCPRVGLVRPFGSLSDMLQESENARVWAGWNFRSTAVESTEMGLRMGEAAAKARFPSASARGRRRLVQ